MRCKPPAAATRPPSSPTQSGSQNVVGPFAELATPIGETTSTQFALRFEDHGRFGSTVNPKVAATTRLGERLRLRGVGR
jgi:outer membrane receptor for ferrienterochelin and colicin